MQFIWDIKERGVGIDRESHSQEVHPRLISNYGGGGEVEENYVAKALDAAF